MIGSFLELLFEVGAHTLFLKTSPIKTASGSKYKLDCVGYMPGVVVMDFKSDLH